MFTISEWHQEHCSAVVTYRELGSDAPKLHCVSAPTLGLVHSLAFHLREVQPVNTTVVAPLITGMVRNSGADIYGTDWLGLALTAIHHRQETSGIYQSISLDKWDSLVDTLCEIYESIAMAQRVALRKLSTKTDT